MIARLFLSHEFIELPKGGKPAIGDGVLWTCKRRRSLETTTVKAVSLGEVGCGKSPQVGTCHH